MTQVFDSLEVNSLLFQLLRSQGTKAQRILAHSKKVRKTSSLPLFIGWKGNQSCELGHIKACKLAISSFNLRDREDPAANPGLTHQSLPTTQCCHGNKTQSDKHYSYWETAPRAYPLSLFKDLLLHVRVHTSLVPRPSSTCVSERVWRSERLFLSLLPDLRAQIRLQNT